MTDKKVPFNQRQENQITTQKQPLKWRYLRYFLIILLLMVIFSIFAAGVVIARTVIGFIDEAPVLDPSRLETAETSYLYDSRGHAITPLHDEQHRIAASLDEIPKHVQQALSPSKMNVSTGIMVLILSAVSGPPIPTSRPEPLSRGRAPFPSSWSRGPS